MSGYGELKVINPCCPTVGRENTLRTRKSRCRRGGRTLEAWAPPAWLRLRCVSSSRSTSKPEQICAGNQDPKECSARGCERRSDGGRGDGLPVRCDCLNDGAQLIEGDDDPVAVIRETAEVGHRARLEDDRLCRKINTNPRRPQVPRIPSAISNSTSSCNDHRRLLSID